MTYSNTEYNPIDNNIEEEINNIIVEYEELPPITELPIFEDITWEDNFIFNLSVDITVCNDLKDVWDGAKTISIFSSTSLGNE